MDWSSICEWEHVSFIEKVILHQVIQEGCAEYSVPVVNDMATIHDITENIDEIRPWNLSTARIGIKIILEYNC